MEEKHEYDDIINRTHHQSKTRPHMSNYDRAAQFSPFAALVGHDAAIEETARLTDDKAELDEYEKARLDEKLWMIAENLISEPEVQITYFQPDERKSGGTYLSVTGCVKKIDEYERVLVLTDKTKIPIEQISELEGKIFRALRFE